MTKPKAPDVAAANERYWRGEYAAMGYSPSRIAEKVAAKLAEDAQTAADGKAILPAAWGPRWQSATWVDELRELLPHAQEQIDAEQSVPSYAAGYWLPDECEMMVRAIIISAGSEDDKCAAISDYLDDLRAGINRIETNHPKWWNDVEDFPQ